MSGSRTAMRERASSVSARAVISPPRKARPASAIDISSSRLLARTLFLLDKAEDVRRLGGDAARLANPMQHREQPLGVRVGAGGALVRHHHTGMAETLWDFGGLVDRRWQGHARWSPGTTCL